MNAVTRKTLFAHMVALSALGLMACPPPLPGPDGGTGGGSAEGCIDDADCGDPTYFFCNTVTAECEASCRTNAHCNQRPAGAELQYCLSGLGCQCDDAKCVGSLCSADIDCGGTQVCRSGACVAPPTVATKCQITPDLVVLRTGSSATFHVSAWNANEPVVIKDGATWTAVGTAVTGSGTGHSATFTAGTTAVTTPTASVQATIGSINCQAQVIVLPTPSANDEIAVSVVDELSGRPVADAKVVLSNGDTGAVVLQGIAEFLPTNAQGYAVLNGFAAGQTVTVFHPDFSYVTVARYSGTTRFLSFALRRNALDKHGGYRGTFTNVPATSNVHAAIGGMSLAGSITNLNITQLLGPSVPTNISIGSTINEMGVPIPAGVFLGFGAQQIKTNIAGLGLNGVCYMGAVADEAAIAVGNCGTRTAWALAGDVPLSDLPISAVAGGLDNINIGELLASILPIFKKFNSSVVRDVQFTMKPVGGTPADPDYTDQTGYTTADHDFAPNAAGTSRAIPFAFNFVAKMPSLPRFKGAYADGVAIIGGANVIGRGIVPLGIGVGVNTGTVDDQIDKVGELAVGQIGVRMAPTHHGIEGSQYGLLAAAISTKALNDASAGIGASALFPRLPSNKLLFDPKGATPIDLSGLTFPTFPENAKFNFSSTADGALTGRTFSMPGFAGVDVIRVSFSDDLETRWDVIAAPAAVNQPVRFTLPTPPLGSRDRLFADGVNTGTARSTMVVQAFRMSKDPSAATLVPVTFNDYVEVGATSSINTTNFLTGFSFLTISPPSVKFTTPAASGTVAKGSKLALEVSGFSIGTAAANDGVVKLSFTGGTNCPDVILKTETMAANGKLEHTLPADCVGAAIVTRAELLKIDETSPLVPAVSRNITLTIAP